MLYSSRVPIWSGGFCYARNDQQRICEILDLDIDRIHIHLLGLVIDLSPVHLDITALQGAGNLLGDLLCAGAGLSLIPTPISPNSSPAFCGGCFKA